MPQFRVTERMDAIISRDVSIDALNMAEAMEKAEADMPGGVEIDWQSGYGTFTLGYFTLQEKDGTLLNGTITVRRLT